MMKKLSCLAFFLTTAVHAGLPPTTVKGQSETSPTTTFNVQAPYNQATTTAGVTRYIDSGNRNLLLNSSFEASTFNTSWTTTTATSSVEATIVTDGKKSAHLAFSGSTGDIAQSVTPAIQMSALTFEASCKVNTSLSTIQVCALLAGTETQCVSVNPGSIWGYYPISFAGPSSGSVGVRVKTSSSTTGDVYVDDCYVGPARSQAASIQQATVYGTALGFAAASCNWSDNSGVFATPAADTDCLFPTVTGGLSAEATHLPGFNMNSAPPGQYIVTATFQGSASSGNSSYALWDGTTRTSLVEIGNGTNTSSELRSVTLVGVYNYTTAGNRTLNLQCRSGGNACEITANSAFMDLSFTVQRMPSQSQIVDNQNVNTPWNSSLAFTFTNFGTVSNNSFVTSRINDSLEVRGSMNAGTTVATAGTINLPAGYVIDGSKLTAGNNIVGYMQRATSTSTAVAGSSTGPWFLFYDGSNTGSLFFADNTSSQNLLKALANDTSSGDKLWFNFTVPIVGWGATQAYYIPGSVITASVAVQRVSAATVNATCTASPCTIASQTGDISTITRTGTGQYSINFAANTWTVAPTCIAYPGNTSSVIGTRASSTTTTSAFTFLTFDNTFANIDIAFSVQCVGAK